MVYINFFFLLFYVTVIVVTMITVLMDNRQPAKTMAWLMVLVFLPVIGIVLYVFFGQNIRKERLISQRSLDKLTKQTMFEYSEQRNLVIAEPYRMLVRLFANQSMSLPFKDNQTEIYTSGADFFLSLLRAIGSAKHHIHLVSYIFEDDALGNLIADALTDKAREGVEVRVIYDDVGCWQVPNAFWNRMRRAGIEVCAFMPVRFPAFTSKINYRNHRKLCVVDGKVGFIGGMNIARRYVKGTKKQRWKDTHLRIEGGAVYGIQRAFLIDWYFVSRILLTDACYYPCANRHEQSRIALVRYHARLCTHTVRSKKICLYGKPLLPAYRAGFVRHAYSGTRRRRRAVDNPLALRCAFSGIGIPFLPPRSTRSRCKSLFLSRGL